MRKEYRYFNPLTTLSNPSAGPGLRSFFYKKTRTDYVRVIYLTLIISSGNILLVVATNRAITLIL